LKSTPPRSEKWQGYRDLAILRDVTERKKTEIKLKENKDLIDGIMASTPDAVFVTDRIIA